MKIKLKTSEKLSLAISTIALLFSLPSVYFSWKSDVRSREQVFFSIIDITGPIIVSEGLAVEFTYAVKNNSDRDIIVDDLDFKNLVVGRDGPFGSIKTSIDSAPWDRTPFKIGARDFVIVKFLAYRRALSPVWQARLQEQFPLFHGIPISNSKPILPLVEGFNVFFWIESVWAGGFDFTGHPIVFEKNLSTDGDNEAPRLTEIRGLDFCDLSLTKYPLICGQVEVKSSEGNTFSSSRYGLGYIPRIEASKLMELQ